ncbi:MAG: DUF5615 family PIN-like protein [Thermodesulfobacteriota bacterium]
MIRILLDQGLPRSTATHLRDQGWDVAHTGDIGLSRAKDEEILGYALHHGRIIITLDSDFHAYLAVTNSDAPSVIRIRIEGLKSHEMAELIIAVWPQIDEAVHQGAMVTVTENAIRMHALPVSE